MNALIEVFRMTEISAESRANVIIKLGDAINYQYGSNVTEPLVYELVSILDPSNAILKDNRYLQKS
jgi:hypothetical protein